MRRVTGLSVLWIVLGACGGEATPGDGADATVDVPTVFGSSGETSVGVTADVADTSVVDDLGADTSSGAEVGASPDVQPVGDVADGTSDPDVLMAADVSSEPDVSSVPDVSIVADVPTVADALVVADVPSVEDISGSVDVAPEVVGSEDVMEPPTSECGPCGSCGLLDCWLWYSPSNAAAAGSFLPDFQDLFDASEQWSSARANTGVMLVKANSLKQLNDTDFIEAKLVPRMLEWGMRLALDVAGATWASCWASLSTKLNPDVYLIDRVIAAGGSVEFLGLQSVLSKPLPSPLAESMSVNCPPYTMQDRYEDVAWYVAEMKERYPWVKIGLIDALLAHGDDAQALYTGLVEHLDAEGVAIDFILFDHPYHHGEASGVTSWASLHALELFVRDTLGLPTGLYHVSSTGAAASEAQFFEDVLASHAHYTAVGGRPEYHVISSWFLNPQTELPEDAAAPSYPLTKVLGHLADAVIADNEAPIGHFGSVNSEHFAQGWTLDPDTPLLSISVALYVDGPMGEGQLVGEYLADVPRPDVNTATGLPGDHGYKVQMPAWLQDGQEHTLYVYGLDSRDIGEAFQLIGSPTTFTLDP